MMTQKKLEANRRNGERHRMYAAERRIKLIGHIVKLLRDNGPMGPAPLGKILEMNATSVQELMRRMVAANVVKPYQASARCVRTYSLCGSQQDIDTMIEIEKISAAGHRRGGRGTVRPGAGYDMDISERHVTRGPATQQGVARPDYIACLFGSPRGAA